MTYRHKTNRSMTLETLENRSLMAANLTAAVDGGVLKMEGTDGSDQIILTQNNSVLQLNGQDLTYASNVTGIQIDGLGGNDVIRLDSESFGGQAIRQSATIHGGHGDDLLVSHRL